MCAVLLLLSLSAPAWAELTIYTDPKGADLFVVRPGEPPRHLGKSGERLAVSGPLQLRIERAGCEAVTAEVPAGIERWPIYHPLSLPHQTRRITFHSSPEGAELCQTDGGKLVTTTGRPTWVDMTWFTNEQTGAYRANVALRITAPHCQPMSVNLGPADLSSLAQASDWPGAGSTWNLAPADVRYYVTYHGIALTIGGAIAVTLVAFALWQGRRRQHLEAVQQLRQSLTSQDLGDPLIGKRIGDYEVLRSLGHGAMGSVYQVVTAGSLQAADMWAMKLIKPDMAAEPDVVARFTREMKLVASLDHPNIVRAKESGEQDGAAFLVMEWVDGETLADRLEPGRPRPTVDESLQWLRQIGSALEYAHARGVVHRDVKPANVMLTKKGHVKVMDFGLARAAHLTRVTATGTAVGTPAYIAPEQARCLQADARSDQYALGVLAYELFTGHIPFESDDAMSIIIAKLTEPAPACPGVAPEVDAVLRKMLAPNPDDRYRTVAEATQALEAACHEYSACAG
jgi:hypothetical protein